MTIAIKRQLESINKRIHKLNLDNMQLVLDTIIDIDSDYSNLYYKIKVLDRYNNVVEQTDYIYDRPAKYINDFVERYNLAPKLDYYEVINGDLKYIPTILEQEQIDVKIVE